MSTNKTGDFFVVNCSDWVQVVAETDDKKIILVEQYRFGTEKFSLELPGGNMDGNESAIEAGRRELAEETGFCGDEAVILAELSPNPAIQTNTLNVVLIKNCNKRGDTHFDEFEDLKTSFVSKRELVDAIKNGKITNCVTISAIAMYLTFGGEFSC
jgi:8-oxo-dGTP pyrophosphatase MutT (NUDIX family)